MWNVEAPLLFFTLIYLQTLLKKKSSSMHERENVGASVQDFTGVFELSARRNDQPFDDDLPTSAQISLSNTNLKINQIIDD
jgi:hypothetical protein